MAHDSSGFEECYIWPEARKFAGLSTELGNLTSAFATDRASRWWLLLKNELPLLALCEGGQVESSSGDTDFLPDVYREAGGIAPTLWHFLRPHLDL